MNKKDIDKLIAKAENNYDHAQDSEMHSYYSGQVDALKHVRRKLEN